jgi:hypothetical protein
MSVCRRGEWKEKRNETSGELANEREKQQQQHHHHYQWAIKRKKKAEIASRQANEKTDHLNTRTYIYVYKPTLVKSPRRIDEG